MGTSHLNMSAHSTKFPGCQDISKLNAGAQGVPQWVPRMTLVGRGVDGDEAGTHQTNDAEALVKLHVEDREEHQAWSAQMIKFGHADQAFALRKHACNRNPNTAKEPEATGCSQVHDVLLARTRLSKKDIEGRCGLS